MKKDEEHVETYGDEGIASADAPVPKWLKFLYAFLPIWGIVTFLLYWNGSWGWTDPGRWHELQKAAHTTYPFISEDKK